MTACLEGEGDLLCDIYYGGRTGGQLCMSWHRQPGDAHSLWRRREEAAAAHCVKQTQALSTTCATPYPSIKFPTACPSTLPLAPSYDTLLAPQGRKSACLT